MEATTIEICDLHGHFLPGMDDGCKTADESIALLKESYRQGIRKMFATSHYYPVETVDKFLERREQATQCLLERVEQEEGPFPEFVLGAEVAFHTGLSQNPDLHKLCLGQSRYLLLEMPFSKWSSNVVREVSNICSSRGIVPILAHIERYLSNQRPEALEQLLNLNVLVQMNAEPLLHFSSRRQARTMLKNGIVQLLGSDCHNLTTRAPNLGQALSYLEIRGMESRLHRVAQLSQSIFAEAMGEDFE